MRPAINYGHLLDLETIEFRCFMGTFDRTKLKNIIAFPLNYLRMALSNDSNPIRITKNIDYVDYFDFGTKEESSFIQQNREETTAYFHSRMQTMQKVHFWQI